MKSVTLIEYLTLSFKLQMYYLRRWRIRVCMRLVEQTKPTEDLMLYVDSGKFCYNFEGEVYSIPELDPTKAPFKWGTEFKVPKGFLPNIDKPITTTYGKLLLNAIGFSDEFKDLIPYHNEEFKPNVFNKAYYKLYRAGKIERTSQLLNSVNRLHMLEADAEFGVPAASIETFTTHPDMEKVVKEQLDKYKDELGNPSTGAKIDKVTVQLDRDYVKGTQAEKFLISNTLHDTVRKKTQMMYGSETGLDGKPTPIIGRALKDGVDLERMPDWVDIARNGAISRGGMTALGGYEVKLDDAAYGHLEVSEGDCKTKRGLTVSVTLDNNHRFLGMRLLSDNNILDESKVEKFVGKPMTIRAPSHCVLTTDYCEYCMGELGSKGKYSIPSEVAVLDSNSMGSMMSAAHGKAAKSVLVDLAKHLR